MKPFTILVALALCGCATTDDAWTSGDSKLFGAYVIAASADTYTTTRFQYYYPLAEANPIVRSAYGPNPRTSDLWQGQIALIGINYLIARSLPERWRRRYLGVWTGAHSAAALYNWNAINEADKNETFWRSQP